jgi:hypothetical protein
MSGPNVQLNSSGQVQLNASGQTDLAGTGEACGCGCASAGYAGNCCSNGTPPSSVAIEGYSNTYFSNCPTYFPRQSGDCQWDGTFSYAGYACLYTTQPNCFEGSPCYDCYINQMRQWDTNPPGQPQISCSYNSETRVRTFTLIIPVQETSTTGQVLWEGTKTGGGFTGVYTRTGGCDSRATVEIT